MVGAAGEEEVFVSYAHEDEQFTLMLAKSLLQEGVRVWIDELNIAAGADWDHAIDIALERCSRLLVVLSPSATASQQVKSEWQVALGYRKTVVAVVYRECRVPRQLTVFQYIDVTDGVNDLHASVEAVCAQVGAIIPS